jgi:hypothetical protein
VSGFTRVVRRNEDDDDDEDEDGSAGADAAPSDALDRGSKEQNEKGSCCCGRKAAEAAKAGPADPLIGIDTDAKKTTASNSGRGKNWKQGGEFPTNLLGGRFCRESAAKKR